MASGVFVGVMIAAAVCVCVFLSNPGMEGIVSTSTKEKDWSKNVEERSGEE